MLFVYSITICACCMYHHCVSMHSLLPNDFAFQILAAQIKQCQIKIKKINEQRRQLILDITTLHPSVFQRCYNHHSANVDNFMSMANQNWSSNVNIFMNMANQTEKQELQQDAEDQFYQGLPADDSLKYSDQQTVLTPQGDIKQIQKLHSSQSYSMVATSKDLINVDSILDSSVRVSSPDMFQSCEIPLTTVSLITEKITSVLDDKPKHAVSENCHKKNKESMNQDDTYHSRHMTSSESCATDSLVHKSFFSLKKSNLMSLDQQEKSENKNATRSNLKKTPADASPLKMGSVKPISGATEVMTGMSFNSSRRSDNPKANHWTLLEFFPSSKVPAVTFYSKAGHIPGAGLGSFVSATSQSTSFLPQLSTPSCLINGTDTILKEFHAESLPALPSPTKEISKMTEFSGASVLGVGSQTKRETYVLSSNVTYEPVMHPAADTLDLSFSASSDENAQALNSLSFPFTSSSLLASLLTESPSRYNDNQGTSGSTYFSEKTAPQDAPYYASNSHGPSGYADGNGSTNPAVSVLCSKMEYLKLVGEGKAVYISMSAATVINCLT